MATAAHDISETPDAAEIIAEAKRWAAKHGTSVAYAIGRQASCASMQKRADVRRALETYAREQCWRARRAEGDLAALRSDLAAAHYGVHGDEWTVEDVVSVWEIDEGEAENDR